MAICCGFSFHPENPRMWSSLQHFLGTLLLPPPNLPEGHLAWNLPHLVPHLPFAQLDEALPPSGWRCPSLLSTEQGCGIKSHGHTCLLHAPY